MARDDEVDKYLQAEGWTVLRFWDVDIDKHLKECARAVKEAIFEIYIKFVLGMPRIYDFLLE